MKVRLKLHSPKSTATGSLRFNSMKVRLKLGNVLLHADALPVFQFHEGPIKTMLVTVILPPCLCFNSMKVRLKRRSRHR